MGPRSGERGRARRNSHPAAVVAASMGPRSGERGRAPPSPPPGFTIEPLQWGRARGSAEGLAGIATLLLSWLLQWGRARGSAEGPHRLHRPALRLSRFNGAALG